MSQEPRPPFKMPRRKTDAPSAPAERATERAAGKATQPTTERAAEPTGERAAKRWRVSRGFVFLALTLLVPGGLPSNAESARPAACAEKMVQVGNFCIDQFEASAVEKKSQLPLSPYYPADFRLLKFVYEFWRSEAARLGPERARLLPLPPVPEYQQKPFVAEARSEAHVLPQGYLTYYSAKSLCEEAGKRLCTEDEWTRACRSQKNSKHPYGANYQAGRCNIFRPVHPAHILHGNSSLGHLDPRLHLVFDDDGNPLLSPTGEFTGCFSEFSSGKIYDMVGNLDEWIEDEAGVFVGGFYSRGTRSGCEARVENHGKAYTDYSLGTRCCSDAR